AARGMQAMAARNVTTARPHRRIGPLYHHRPRSRALPRALSPMLALTWIGLSFALLTSAPSEPPLDAQVWTAQGKQVQVKSFWGKPTVLIYESRGATELNRPLKDALWKRGHDPAARDVAQVLGVAALPELDWFPARALAEHAVRERERKVGIPVLIDWKG